MVITKDLSRLGRDYIETGKYLEKFFPEHHIRYIAVTDNIDTLLDYNNDIVPFKSILNDMYAKDISKKIRAALKTKQLEGKFLGGRPPFGYKRDEKDKNHFLIDENSVVVQKIFRLAKMGHSPYDIAKVLTNEKVPTPSQYYHAYWKKESFYQGIWNPTTIKSILKNPMYTGSMVCHKRSKINYKIQKNVYHKREDWIVVPNMHQPIISKRDFDLVQNLLIKKVRAYKRKVYLLDGLLYCGECGHRITIQNPTKGHKNSYTICNYYRSHLPAKLCTPHCMNYQLIEQAVLSLLKQHIQYLSIDCIYEKILSTRKKDFFVPQTSVDLLDKLYLEKLENKITEEQYERLKEKIELEQAKFSKLKSSSLFPSKGDILQYMESFLIRENIIKMIQKIEIFQDKQIQIYLSYSIPK